MDTDLINLCHRWMCVCEVCVRVVDGLLPHLDCGAGFKLEGLGLTVLQVNLQNVGQEQQRVSLRRNIIFSPVIKLLNFSDF